MSCQWLKTSEPFLRSRSGLIVSQDLWRLGRQTTSLYTASQSNRWQGDLGRRLLVICLMTIADRKLLSHFKCSSLIRHIIYTHTSNTASSFHFVKQESTTLILYTRWLSPVPPIFFSKSLTRHCVFFGHERSDKGRFVLTYNKKDLNTENKTKTAKAGRQLANCHS